MKQHPSLVPLTELARRLSDEFGNPVPNYRALWTATVDGKFPAEHINGRWYVHEQHLRTVAIAMGAGRLDRMSSAPARA